MGSRFACVQLAVKARAYYLRRRNCVTTGSISTLGAAVLLVSNGEGFKNIALQAWNEVSYRLPFLRSTVTRW
jgi:hypothetical protein